MNANDFLVALTVVLCVAAVTAVLFQRLHLPVVLGYILAGFIIGPNVPIPLVADRNIVQTLSELGVILLMFSLGLEFSLGKLVKLGPKVGLTAILQSSLMVWLGFVTGKLFGWTTIESLFAGAIIAISSTTIIAKAFDEQHIRGPFRQLVVGILIVEDLIAILLMATLTAIGTGQGLSAVKMAATIGKLALFLVALVAVGRRLVPLGVRALNRLGSQETKLVASIGFCFGISLLAHELGYSVALGAFIAGSLIAESGEHQEIEHLVHPVRDVFAAIFFVSVGILIDPALIAKYWIAIVVFTAVVVVGKIIGVTLGAFLTGSSVRTSVRAGMSLAQIGEFSFIIAELGIALRATGEFIYPVAVAVSAITTLTTPWLIKASGGVANFVDSKLPKPLQTFVTLYGSWIEQLRTRPNSTTRGAIVRRLVRLLLLDLGLLLIVITVASRTFSQLVGFLEAHLAFSPALARIVVVAGVFAIAIPLGVGLVRISRTLGRAIADGALPIAQAGSVDFASAPRRALVLTIEVAIVLLIGLPVLAVTQPLVGGFYGPVLLVLILLGLGIAFWRGSVNLQGHVQAGSLAIVAALVAQNRNRGTSPAVVAVDPLAEIHNALPGMGDLVSIRLEEGGPAVGKTLADINLRGITGATVLAITREQASLIPTPIEVLHAGDVLALTGTHEAIASARDMLTNAASDAQD